MEALLTMIVDLSRQFEPKNIESIETPGNHASLRSGRGEALTLN